LSQLSSLARLPQLSLNCTGTAATTVIARTADMTARLARRLGSPQGPHSRLSRRQRSRLLALGAGTGSCRGAAVHNLPSKRQAKSLWRATRTYCRGAEPSKAHRESTLRSIGRNPGHIISRKSKRFRPLRPAMRVVRRNLCAQNQDCVLHGKTRMRARSRTSLKLRSHM
jgi:hypothetical protein